MTTQNAINWPERYLPGTGDNFVSNEVIVAGLRAADQQVFHDPGHPLAVILPVRRP